MILSNTVRMSDFDVVSRHLVDRLELNTQDPPLLIAHSSMDLFTLWE